MVMVTWGEWAEDENAERVLCGKYEDCSIDIIWLREDAWRVLFESRDTGRQFNSKEKAKDWVDRTTLHKIIFYLS